MRHTVDLGSIAAVLLVLVAGLPATASATCGTEFEACDGIDNDCDGATDEGCSTCWGFSASPVVPFPLDWRTELRAHPDSKDIPLGGARIYGGFMDTNWLFLMSHRMAAFRPTFTTFKTESGFDFLSIGAETITGNMGPHTGNWVVPTSGTDPVAMRWRTDSSVEDIGFVLATLQAFCSDTTTVEFKTIGVNTGVDGIMLNAKDDAYATFTVPAQRQAFVNVDVMGGASMDLDLFAQDVTGGAKPFGSNSNDSDFFAIGGSVTGELLHIPASTSARQVTLRINAFSGSGRYRVFIATPAANLGETVEIAYEDNISFGSAADTRGRDAYRAARAWMLAATDGQYAITCATGTGACTDVDIETDLGDFFACWSCRDIIYMGDDLDDCVPALQTFGPSGSYIEVSNFYWQGTTGCGGPSTPNRVGMTLVHEWGHHEMDITPDERELTGDERIECSHSLMAGSSYTNYQQGGVCHFEFCADHNHFIQPESGASGTFPIFSNWWHLTDEHSGLTPPATGRTPDFSQLVTLGQRMGSFTVFNEL